MLRRSAEVVEDPRLRKQLLQIAAKYEHLVRHEEALCSGRGSEADGARRGENPGPNAGGTAS
jgi:hypothetical protein